MIWQESRTPQNMRRRDSTATDTVYWKWSSSRFISSCNNQSSLSRSPVCTERTCSSSVCPKLWYWKLILNWNQSHWSPGDSLKMSDDDWSTAYIRVWLIWLFQGWYRSYRYSRKMLCQNNEQPLMKQIRVQFTYILCLSTILPTRSISMFCYFIHPLHYIHWIHLVTSYYADSENVVFRLLIMIC